MWWQIGIAIVCLIIGYWIGHWRGWTDHQDEIGGDIDYMLGKRTEAQTNVIWCYRNILQRDPENASMVNQWASANPSLRQLAKTFKASEEFKCMMPDQKARALKAIETIR